MTIRRSIAPPTRAAVGALSLLAWTLGACSAQPVPTAVPSETPPAPTQRPTPAPTPFITPTPVPTPRFTNPPDPELAALFPAAVGGVPVVLPPTDEFALTPGDVGLAYGEVGLRFSSLVIAYTEQPRLTLYAVRAEGPPVTTVDLEPHLATAGRYVGVAGLQREPWELTEAGDHEVWMRPEDDATAAGTRIYTWSSGEYVFLLIGVDDGLNRALIAALPGDPAPSPSPASSPSRTPGPSGTGG